MTRRERQAMELFGVADAPSPAPPRTVHDLFRLGVPAEALGFEPGRPRSPFTVRLASLPPRRLDSTPRTNTAWNREAPRVRTARA